MRALLLLVLVSTPVSALWNLSGLTPAHIDAVGHRSFPDRVACDLRNHTRNHTAAGRRVAEVTSQGTLSHEVAASRLASLENHLRDVHPGFDDASFRAGARATLSAAASTLSLELGPHTEYRAALFAVRAALLASGDGVVGVTHLAMLDPDEVRSVKGYVPHPKNPKRHLQEDDSEVPPSYDMRAVPGLLNPIKDQGECGCCWAFAAVAAVETTITVGGGELVSLSEQQLLDCSGYSACGGGDALFAWNTFQAPNGAVPESVMPFLEMDADVAPPRCDETLVDANKVVTVGDDEIEYGRHEYEEAGTILSSTEDVQAHILQEGAVVMSLDAACLEAYVSGIITPSNCDLCSGDVDHQLTIVGWGNASDAETGVPFSYWILRNQWGTDWGEDGYARMTMGMCSSDSGLYVNAPLTGTTGAPTAPTVPTSSPSAAPTIEEECFVFWGWKFCWPG